MELRRAFFPLIALSVIACATSPLPVFGQAASLPPPQPIFDPTPGPWIIGFKPNSAEYLDDSQAEIVRTAMQSWGRLDGYGFLLCYDGENRGTLPIAKLQTVAKALYEAGATSVITGSPLCHRLTPFPWSPTGGVIILGVTTFRR